MLVDDLEKGVQPVFCLPLALGGVLLPFGHGKGLLLPGRPHLFDEERRAWSLFLELGLLGLGLEERVGDEAMDRQLWAELR